MVIPLFKWLCNAPILSCTTSASLLTVVSISLSLCNNFRRPAPTYETATTRKYFHGRTETVRSCTKECVVLAKVIMNPEASKKQKADALSTAIKKTQQVNARSDGWPGYCKCILISCGLPQVFDNFQAATAICLVFVPLQLKTTCQIQKYFQILLGNKGFFCRPLQKPTWLYILAYCSGGDGNFILSTSFIGYSIVFGGVAPMCANGYGTFYKMLPDRLYDILYFYKTIMKKLDSN